EKYNFKEFLITFLLNTTIFFILLLFHKKLTIILSLIFYTLAQSLIRAILEKIYKKNIRVIVLGQEIFVENLKELLLNDSDYTYLGFVAKNIKYGLGEVIELDKIINKFKCDMIIYIKEEEEEYLNNIFDLKIKRRKVIDSEAFLQHKKGKVSIENLSKKYIINSQGFDMLTSNFENRIKRFGDISLSLITLILTFPLMILIYLLVKLDSPKYFFSNPAFFKQKRIGIGGRSFEIIKFRSMKIHDSSKHSRYTLKNDNRVTFIGKFIRKTRLDELPQIINILKGNMSFVGPRPEWDELGREYEKKIKFYNVRYAVKPGLTGWAQVMYPYGCNLEDAKQKLEYDLYYIKYQNFTLDIIILFKTLKIIFFGKGL
ncbi:MAG: exopolysaccharide biosynthesis polyprenyl glycosylphosphotransferase, partial [Cetobacterium sp.]